jgi:hypothetical protein
MTPRQFTFLHRMIHYTDTLSTDWVRLMDIGGESGSHHASTARNFIAKGWIESRARSSPSGKPGQRVSKLYRLTPKGREAFHNHATLANADRRVKFNVDR